MLRMPRLSLVGAASIAAFSVSVVPAAAASLSVQMACANDYYAYCAKHDPDSPATRACMRANGNRLSDRCVNALVAAGEISKSEAAKKAASTRR